jgi:hypothetical protein
MKLLTHSYRFAQEILEHRNNAAAWTEISAVLSAAPIFVYPGKSKSNPKLTIVQQLMNTYFDRRFAVDLGWEYHPLATGIEKSGLAADFRKSFGDITIQAEIQFGNMARWYSDIFKFQTAYSQSMINCGLCVVPVAAMARVTDSNVTQYERAVRELPSAKMSITLPILVIGLEQDADTPIVDVSQCLFDGPKDVTKTENRWRIVNGYLAGIPMDQIGPSSPVGPMLDDSMEDES